MYRKILLFSAVSGAITVILGAMGAHGLREHFHLDDAHMQVYEAAVRYQAIHTLVLLALSLWLMHFPSSIGNWSAILFGAGIVLFSGSLYFLALRPVILDNDDFKFVGIITPFGGLAFISGWILLFVYALKLKK